MDVAEASLADSERWGDREFSAVTEGLFVFASQSSIRDWGYHGNLKLNPQAISRVKRLCILYPSRSLCRQAVWISEMYERTRSRFISVVPFFLESSGAQAYVCVGTEDPAMVDAATFQDNR